MSNIKWYYKRLLSNEELNEIAYQILLEDLPLDNNIDTDVEKSDNEENFETSLLNTFGKSFKKSETDTKPTENGSTKTEISDNNNNHPINILQNILIIPATSQTTTSSCKDEPNTYSISQFIK